MLVVTLPAIASTLSLVRHVKQIRPDLHIVARINSSEDREVLNQMGVYEIVQPEYEAALELTRQALLHLGLPGQEIQRFADQARITTNPLSFDQVEEQAAEQLNAPLAHLNLHWLTIPPDSDLVGLTLRQSQIRARTGFPSLPFSVIIRFFPIPGHPWNSRSMTGWDFCVRWMTAKSSRRCWSFLLMAWSCSSE